jgi:hypothetical protein
MYLKVVTETCLTIIVVSSRTPYFTTGIVERHSEEAPTSPLSSRTLATQHRHPPTPLQLTEHLATGMRRRDEGGGTPFPFPQALLPAAGGLVGSRLWAASSSAPVTDPWLGWSDLGHVRTDLAEPSTEEWRRQLQPPQRVAVCGGGGFSGGVRGLSAGWSRPPWRGCGAPRAGAVDYLGGGVRHGACRQRLPR